MLGETLKWVRIEVLRLLPPPAREPRMYKRERPSGRPLLYQASGFDWPELAKPHLRPNLAQDIDDAADQPGRGVDRVNPVALVIVLLA